MKQIEVINLETIIDVTAETSNVEILVQDYDSELAERFALEAQEAAIDAEESADIATAQASIATAQAGIATTQAGIATTQAGNALTSANNAAASAQEAQDIVDSIITADLTEATSSVLTITGGTDAVLGTGTTIQVKQAGSSQSGFLSSTDWTTFNSKQNAITNPVTGTGASGQVAFWTGVSTQQGSNNLTWGTVNLVTLSIQGSSLTASTLPTLDLYNVSEIDTTRSIINFRGQRSGIGIAASIRASRRGLLEFYTQDLPSLTDPVLRWTINTAGILESNGAQTIQTSSGALTLQSGNRNVLINTTTDAGFRLDVNGTARVQGRITNVAPSIANTREILYRGSVSDNANDAFIIANGTSADSVFAPNFVGFNQSSSLLWGLGFTGLLTSTNDATDSSVFGVIRFNAARTDNAADPINGTFTSIANRKLFTFENNAVPVGTVFRTGNWLIQNGGTATDAGFRLDVNGTARVSGNLTTNLTQGSVPFIGASGLLTQNNSLFFISSFTDLGIGTNTPRKSTFFSRALTVESNGITGTEIVGTQTNLTGTVAAISFINNSNTETTFQKRLAQITVVNSGSANSGDLSLGVFDGATFRQPIFIKANGNVLIGTTTDVASSKLTIESTTQGVLFPRMTTTQKNAIASPATGLVVYDTTLNKLCVRGALTWETITSL